MLGVHEEDSGTDRVRGIDAAKKDVLKEGAAEACSLMLSVNRKPGEENRRDGPGAWLALQSASGRFVGRELGRSERVIADDRLTVIERGDEYARRA